MEYDPNDNSVIHLLKKLKDANGTYPPEMLALRRQGYLKQVAEISSGAGLAMGLKNLAKSGKGSAGLSSTAGTIVELLLVVALVVEAGAVTYFYRDKVAEYFRSITNSPKVEEVASPSISMISSPIVELQVTPSPDFTMTVPGVTGTVTGTGTSTPGTPSGTPSAVLAAGTTRPNGTNTVSVQSASTAVSSVNTGGGSTGNTGNTGASAASTEDPKGNNGNHYGQTPKPERTKESGNNPSFTQVSETKDKKKP